VNLFHLLDGSARRFADREAVFHGTELFATYAELHRRALALANALGSMYEPGSRIAIVSENRPEYVELMFGVWGAGMVAVPLNANLHAKEVAQIAEDAQAAVVFASPKHALPLAGQLRAQRPVVAIGETAYQQCLDAAPAMPVEVRPEQLAWLFYTSGTTGRPKGAMLSHRNLLAMAVAHLADIEQIDEHASQIHAAPMSHGSGMYIPAYIARGARQVIPASGAFEPDEFLALCNVHASCGAFLAPTMVQRLRQEVERSGLRPRHLRCIVYGGGPMYVDELTKSIKTFGHVFAQIYGQGEAPMTITGMRCSDHVDAGENVLGSVGWPRAGVEVRVVDGKDRDLPAGEIGEIVCRGDVVMAGYWNNPAATADTLRGGWLHTGDMGSFDERGCLTLRDRSKDVVISGGSNIYPREVEEVLLRHPGVAEVCVVGAPDPEWGEIVVAFIVPSGGASVTQEELDAHCLANIARFKRPKRYLFIGELPKNSTGKVLKRELRKQI
jgi:acyl-CoA synthetase (AMP-forming)/AMP-acid ligase II